MISRRLTISSSQHMATGHSGDRVATQVLHNTTEPLATVTDPYGWKKGPAGGDLSCAPWLFMP